jgi:hypothetical protein
MWPTRSTAASQIGRSLTAAHLTAKDVCRLRRMFRRFAAAVATSREDQRPPRVVQGDASRGIVEQRKFDLLAEGVDIGLRE